MDQPSSTPKRQLNLFDSTCIIVGIIIGSTIYASSWLIAASVPNAWSLVGIWALGGLISLIGALCYAELATAYPHDGGDYVYLKRGFGRPVGFLFAWAQLWIVRPGSIGALAYVFAEYAYAIAPIKTVPMGLGLTLYAAGSIAILTLINILGVREGKWTQNLLTTIKVLGLLAIVAAGMFASNPTPLPEAAAAGGSNFRLALILVLLAYGGWNEMAYVAAEVRNPERNILRSLVLGTVAVTAIYVLVTIAFVHALGFAGLTQSRAVASDVLGKTAGAWGSSAIATLICISALGGINGMIFTGGRIIYALGRDYSMYSWFGRWNEGRGTPIRSILVQSGVALALVIGFGRTAGGFEALVNFTTPVFWIFFFLVGLTLFVLRWRDPGTPRPFRVPLYPVIPILFCASSLFMIYSSVSYAVENRSWEALWSIGVLAVGIVLLRFDEPAPVRGSGFDVIVPVPDAPDRA